MSQPQPATAGPADAINQAYLNCYEARRHWIELSSIGASGAEREVAHVELHETTMTWFETLIPYISERQDEAREYWENAPLWPIQPVTEEIAVCTDCDFSASLDDCEGAQCPDCGAALQAVETEVTDEHGRTLYYWQQGLKNLVYYIDRTEIKKEVRGQFDKRIVEKEEAQRLEPDSLLRVARHLDNAARELDLLAETDDEMAVGKL